MESPPAPSISELIEALSQAQMRANEAEAEVARVRAINSDLVARNAHLELQNEKMRRTLHGRSSERARHLIDQMELEYEELEATASQDEIAAQLAAAKTTNVAAFTRKRHTRREFPPGTPVERVVIPADKICPCCGSDNLSKLGEDIHRAFETIPAQHKIIETVRERFSCRSCQTITQPPAPFHVTPRAMFGPHFLASLAFNKFGLNQPLNSQRDRLESQGFRFSLSTLADQIGWIAAAVTPVFLLLEEHSFAGGRLHGDDTTVPRLAKYRTEIARMWTYVCDDAPFGGDRAPAALFYYSRDRKGEHSREHLARYQGILQADNYAGYNALYDPGRPEGVITHAACWAHARRYFFELADIATQLKRKPGKRVVISPLALEAVQRIDRIFQIERDINGRPAAERLAVRKILSVPLVDELGDWMREQRSLLSSKDEVGKKMDYMLNAWPAFTAFLHDGRICLTNNAAERAIRAVARGRKNWLFVGSDRGGVRAAMMFSLIATCRLNDVDPLAWLTDVLTRIADLPQTRLHELLPWTWKALREPPKTAQAA
jgi:transposase/regulator of replication initiation timing